MARQSKRRSRSTAGRASRAHSRAKTTGRGSSPGKRSLASRPRADGASAGARHISRGPARRTRAPATRTRRTRGAGSAPYAVKLLLEDHRAVERAFEEFRSAAHEQKRPIAERICKLLSAHSVIEEELLYPAAREALRPQDAHLVSEGRVEHGAMKDLIARIESVDELDELYEARVTVLGEYVRNHVGEEERELFPKLGRTSLDLESIGERIAERKKELMGSQAPEESQEEEEGHHAPPPPARGRSGGRAHRSGALHARRR